MAYGGGKYENMNKPLPGYYYKLLSGADADVNITVSSSSGGGETDVSISIAGFSEQANTAANICVDCCEVVSECLEKVAEYDSQITSIIGGE